MCQMLKWIIYLYPILQADNRYITYWGFHVYTIYIVESQSPFSTLHIIRNIDFHCQTISNSTSSLILKSFCTSLGINALNVFNNVIHKTIFSTWSVVLRSVVGTYRYVSSKDDRQSTVTIMLCMLKYSHTEWRCVSSNSFLALGTAITWNMSIHLPIVHHCWSDNKQP